MAAPRLDARAMLALGVVGVIWTCSLSIIALATSPAVIAGATIDVAVTAPIGLYAIAVRGGHLPRWVLVLTTASGLAVMSQFGGGGRVVLAIAMGVELAMVALLVVRTHRAARAWRLARAEGAPAGDALLAALAAIGMPPLVANVIATELTVFMCVATGWRRPLRSVHRFTVHRENGWAMIVGAFTVLGLGELVLVHILLLAFTSSSIAWIVSGVSMYGMLWILGDLFALRHGGVVIGDRALELAIGVRWRGVIPWSSIASIERAAASDGSLDVSILGANTVVRLHHPCVLRGLFGRRREATVIALSIDDAARFVDRARLRLAPEVSGAAPLGEPR